MDTLIFDFSQIAHSTFHAQVRFDKDLKSDYERFSFHKYLILNSIKKTKQKFNPDEIILAFDNNSWRTDFFPYYKARRKLKRKDDNFDSQQLYEAIEEMKNEFEEYFPYKVIHTEGAEGDDVIAVLTQDLLPYRNKIVIASRDKDFRQLLRYDKVLLYDAIADEMVKSEDPVNFLLEHILSGDSGDDIPNILSEDKIFLMDGKRQKAITKKIKQEYFENPNKFIVDNNLVKNYDRNKKLIDLSIENIPQDVVGRILDSYKKQKLKRGDVMMLLRYFRSKKMTAFADAPKDFMT